MRIDILTLVLTKIELINYIITTISIYKKDTTIISDLVYKISNKKVMKNLFR